jgi:peptidoglycan/LPS O-acetylase OafA/YrhL
MMLDRWVSALPYVLEQIIRRGYLAVGTFFVLSGFVLARSYVATEWNRGNLTRYCVGRFARIYPVYALSLLVVAPFIIDAKLPDKPALLAKHGLLLQGWTGTLPVNWNTPAWSLSCEVFFYLCFPLVAVLANKLNWWQMAVAAVGACLWPDLVLAAGMPVVWLPLVHLSDFAMGIFASRTFDLLPRLHGRGYWFYLPGFVIATVLIAHPEILRKALDLNSAMRPFNALILVGLALGGGLPARGLSTRLAVYLGKSSYSMYILHIPVLWWWRRLVPQHFGQMPETHSAFAYVGGVVVLSAAVFRWVEEPSSKFLRRVL